MVQSTSSIIQGFSKLWQPSTSGQLGARVTAILLLMEYVLWDWENHDMCLLHPIFYLLQDGCSYYVLSKSISKLSL